MKSHLCELLHAALQDLQTQNILAAGALPEIGVDHARDRQHGDFASNIALTLAKAAQRKPRELAQQIVAHLPASDKVARVEIAGPGFINFFLAPAAWQEVVNTILDAGAAYGRAAQTSAHPVQVEFVSANPNGPLHVGHGRGAAIGSALANLLEAAGLKVQREYYVNDAGRQMDILAASVWLRYLELCGEPVVFPVNGYKGAYVYDIARALQQTHATRLRHALSEVMRDVPPDAAADDSGDKEAHIDALIARMKALLGADDYRAVFDLGLSTILADIRDDLAEFGVRYDHWFSERSLTASGAVQRAVERLKQSGYLYEAGGAWWFRSTAFGDEKDRVVVRENGQPTYFASDIAYHLGKYERGFERIVNVWGADHHGYIPRVKAALSALGEDAARLHVVLVQFAILFRGKERAQMSTRAGAFVTLRSLRAEVGNDAARFFYVMRKSDQHLDFDLELATSRSNENPVYYVQYAHARICSVLKQGEDKGWAWSSARGRAHLDLLVEGHEWKLLATLARYPALIEAAAALYEPHQIAYYLMDLATDFHTYYNAQPFLVADDNLRDARLSLLVATRQVLRNGLDVLGVSAPTSMQRDDNDEK
ncbi:MAG: arginine--tRNA ligase [Gammaproteobacteria bacterium]|nr:arginine--tRNA ligase [Gammaproteobacteria bacterium]